MSIRYVLALSVFALAVTSVAPTLAQTAAPNNSAVAADSTSNDVDDQQQIAAGKAACDAGDFGEALRLWAPMADKGLAAAEFNLGVMYEYGQGVSPDMATAVAWYEKSANQGFADAEFRLGALYDIGKGVRQDYATAVLWYTKAAD